MNNIKLFMNNIKPFPIQRCTACCRIWNYKKENDDARLDRIGINIVCPICYYDWFNNSRALYDETLGQAFDIEGSQFET